MILILFDLTKKELIKIYMLKDHIDTYPNSPKMVIIKITLNENFILHIQITSKPWWTNLTPKTF